MKDTTLNLQHNKWFKNFEKGHLEIKEQLYSLQTNDNKRQLVYNKYNKLVKTIPFKIFNGKIIE